MIRKRQLKRKAIDTSGKEITEGRPAGKKLPESIRAAIIGASQFTRLTQQQIADEYKVNIATVRNVMKKFREDREDSEGAFDITKRIERVNTLAFDAVESGLRHKKDPYRQGTLGKDVLKGTGVFKPDSNTVINNQNALALIPEEFRERYVGSQETSDEL